MCVYIHAYIHTRTHTHTHTHTFGIFIMAIVFLAQIFKLSQNLFRRFFPGIIAHEIAKKNQDTASYGCIDMLARSRCLYSIIFSPTADLAKWSINQTTKPVVVKTNHQYSQEKNKIQCLPNNNKQIRESTWILCPSLSHQRWRTLL